MTAVSRNPMPLRAHYFGASPVPWTVSWTAEEGQFLAHCPYSSRLAICQKEAFGVGKPLFGKPHSVRQRRAIALSLCDICAQPLKRRTKVSLSHARPQPHSARGFEVLQVEPLLCKQCAAVSMEHCPSLKRDIRNGALRVRQVFQSDVQFALMSPQYVEEMTGEARVAVGHAKVQLIKWKDRDAHWLIHEAAP